MGWASGSRLFADIIPIIESYVPEDERVNTYLSLIGAFVDHDWDTLDECVGVSKSYDEAYNKWYSD